MLHIQIVMTVDKTKFAKEALHALRDRCIELRRCIITWRRDFVEERLSRCRLDKHAIWSEYVEMWIQPQSRVEPLHERNSACLTFYITLLLYAPLYP